MAPTIVLFAVAALCSSVFALPSPAESPENREVIGKRDNYWNLKCGNAPDVVAGNMLPADQGLTLPRFYPESGSNEQGMQYIYCTPGTETYVFLSLLSWSPPPIPYVGIPAAFVSVNQSLSDEEDMQLSDGTFTLNPKGTNVQIHMQNSGKNGKLTWGIVQSAIIGLTTWNQAYNSGCNGGSCGSIIFQVNDGIYTKQHQWAEVGIGYAAYWEDSTSTCLLASVGGGNNPKTTTCSSLDKVIV